MPSLPFLAPFSKAAGMDHLYRQVTELSRWAIRQGGNLLVPTIIIICIGEEPKDPQSDSGSFVLFGAIPTQEDSLLHEDFIS